MNEVPPVRKYKQVNIISIYRRRRTVFKLGQAVNSDHILKPYSDHIDCKVRVLFTNNARAECTMNETNFYTTRDRP